MSDPLVDRLSRLTPDGSGLDRGTLLFEAGRASARPNRPWIALCLALALTQGVTLVTLWPRPTPPPLASPALTAPTTATPAEEEPRPTSDPAQGGPLARRPLAEPAPLAPDDSLVPDAPPLRAFASAVSLD